MATLPKEKGKMVAMEEKGESPSIEERLEKLNLQGEEEEELDFSGEVEELVKEMRWLAIFRVHTVKPFSHTALFSALRNAWATAKDANRHIIPSGGCSVCNTGAEDVKHLVFSCQRARAVWTSLCLWNKISQLMNTDRSGSVILQEVIRRGEQCRELDVGFAELILTAGWYLWWERRQVTHGENVQSSQRSGLAIAALTKSYKLAKKRGSKVKQGWKRPPEDCVMVNIDASYKQEGVGSTGVIIRDSGGSMIAASISFIQYLESAQVGEAVALKEGLLLARHIGANRIIIQSDCMEVVDIMRDSGFTANSAVAVYDECASLCQEFVKISIEHIGREANQAAHALARQK